MKGTNTIKVSADLLELARADAAVLNRSVGGQVEFWARLGKSVENMPSMTLERIKSALDGTYPIEDLSVDELAIYDDMESLLRWERSKSGNPDLAKKFMAEAGHRGYDDAGNLVETVGDGKNVRVIKPAIAE